MTDKKQKRGGWKIKDTSRMGSGNRGKHLPEEVKRKISEAQKGRKYPYKSHPKQKGFIPWNKGKHIKLNDALRTWRENGGIVWNKQKEGCKKTDKQKEKIKKIAKERNYGKWMKGKKLTEEHKKNISLSLGGDGITMAFNPYPSEFNLELKLKIRKRDNFTCCLCGRTEREELEELNRVLCINHIDFNKNNCKENNLNTLCLRCNVKINRERDYWKNYFNNSKI